MFCCLGTTTAKAGSREAFRKVNYDYVVKLAELALKGPIRRFFQEFCKTAAALYVC